MSNNPFAALGIDVPQIVAQTIGTMASVSATLSKITPGTYDPASPGTGNRPTTATYTCKVLCTQFIADVVQDEVVRNVSGKILVLLGTMSTQGISPAPGDTITVIPPTGASHAFVINGKVVIDATGATAECEVQG